MIVWGFEASSDARPRGGHSGRQGLLAEGDLAGGVHPFAPRRRPRRGAALARPRHAHDRRRARAFEERDRVRERAVALSTREREVLALVARGARNRQIAQALSISEFTVKRHMQNILHKLDLPVSQGGRALLPLGLRVGRESSRWSGRRDRRGPHDRRAGNPARGGRVRAIRCSPKPSREHSRESPRSARSPAGQGDTADFLRLLQPAAVVVDSAEEAEAAAEFAREARATLVQFLLREDRLRLLHAGRWQNLSDGSASPERIRSAVAAGIYLRGVRT